MDSFRTEHPVRPYDSTPAPDGNGGNSEGNSDAAPPSREGQYPCDRCGKLRTKAEGGTTFTVCDECWDATRAERTGVAAPPSEPTLAERLEAWADSIDPEHQGTAASDLRAAAKFAKLPDHPRRNGLSRCPHCMAEGLDALRDASAATTGDDDEVAKAVGAHFFLMVDGRVTGKAFAAACRAAVAAVRAASAEPSGERPIRYTGQREILRLMDALELAWGVIANVDGGDWTGQSPEWQQAAARWRDEQWHPALDRTREVRRAAAPVSEPQRDEKGPPTERSQ